MKKNILLIGLVFLASCSKCTINHKLQPLSGNLSRLSYPAKIKQLQYVSNQEVSTTLLFFNNHFSLSPKYQHRLEKIVKRVTQDCKGTIQVDGFASTTGTFLYNAKLSEKRAKFVRNFLENHGVDSMRIKVHGYGETRPVATNATEDGRRLNRRVEFTVHDCKQLG
jgi:outer membrane protein OmpA-like peptidoglycan-associated protein